MVDVNQLLEDAGVNTAGMPRASTASGNINLYQDLMSTIGNPVFLLQQGLVTPEEFQQTMQMLTSVPVDANEYDFETLQNQAEMNNDNEIVVGYNLIKRGYTVDGVLREAKRANPDVDVDLLRADLELFKQRWDNAQGLEADVLTGQVKQVGGQWFKSLPSEDARKIYAAAGLPDYLQNPLLWETIPDPQILARAVAGEQEAVDLAKRLNATSRAAAKTATRQAQDVYKQMQAQAAAGAAAGQRDVIQQETRAAYESSAFRPTQQSRAAASPPVAGGKATTTRATGAQQNMKPLAQWVLNKFKGVQDRNSNEAILARMSPQAREQAMKAAATYAGKSAMELDPQLSKIKQQVAAKNEQVKNLKSQAIQKGTIPAINILQQALPVAAMMATPQPRVQASRPAPRVLSDQEIQSMANMIAGGII